MLTLNSVFGEIKLHYYENNEDRKWPVYSDCKLVRIRSTLFQTEKEYDYLTIGKTVYSGKTKIDRILSTNFTVGFSSDNKRTDKGFVLNWECLSWGEWTHVDGGSCKEEMRPQLEYKGLDQKTYIKYRDINETCGEFINF